MDFRSFFKPAGTNPEIEGPYYELSSFAVIVGHSNFEALTLGFKKGSSITKMTFRPIDPTKPIVLAVDDMTSIGFVYIDYHLENDAKAGMRNFDLHKTDDFLIDCQRRDIIDGGREYWSVTSEGMTFVFGEKTFPNTWRLSDGDQLCAFVAGELTANQLRMNAYLSDREAVKEERREAHIQRLKRDLDNAIAIGKAAVIKAKTDVETANSRYERLVHKLKSAMSGVFPFIAKAKVLQVLKDNS